MCGMANTNWWERSLGLLDGIVDDSPGTARQDRIQVLAMCRGLLDQDHAAEVIERLHCLSVPTDHMQTKAAYHTLLGRAYGMSDHYGIARDQFQLALDATLSWARHTPHWTIAARVALARAETRLGDLDAAEAVIGAALTICREHESRVRRQTFYEDYAHARVAAAELRWAQGVPDAARSEREAAIQLVKRLGTRYQSRATILLDLAGLSAQAGELRDAQRLVEQVQDRWSRRLVAFHSSLRYLQRMLQDVDQVIRQVAEPTSTRDLP